MPRGHPSASSITKSRAVGVPLCSWPPALPCPQLPSAGTCWGQPPSSGHQCPHGMEAPDVGDPSQKNSMYLHPRQEMRLIALLASLSTGSSAPATAMSLHGNTLPRRDTMSQHCSSFAQAVFCWADSKQVAAPDEEDFTSPRGPKMPQTPEIWLSLSQGCQAPFGNLGRGGLLLDRDRGGPHPCCEL